MFAGIKHFRLFCLIVSVEKKFYDIECKSIFVLKHTAGILKCAQKGD
jgi:hypothetical protein